MEPVTKNIYFTVVVKERTAAGSANTASSLICVLSQKGDFAAIIGGMSEPRDIVLHPTKRFVGRIITHLANVYRYGQQLSVV